MKVNKKELAIVILVLAVVLLAAFYDVIFLNKTLTTNAIVKGTLPSGPYGVKNERIYDKHSKDPGPFAWHHEPAAILNRESFRAGEWPLWNPYNATGTPNAADMQAGSFTPMPFLFYLFPNQLGWDMFFLMRLFIAGLFTYLFTRLLKISIAGSLVAAIGFMLSSYLVSYITMNHLNVEIMLPVIMYFTQRLLLFDDKFSYIGLPLSISLSVTGGMPESTVMIMFLAISYFLFSLYKKSNWLPLLVKYILFLGIAALTSAVTWLPFLEYERLSWNIHHDLVGGWSLPLKSTIAILIPNYFGSPRQNWAGFPVSKIGSFLSTSLLMLAVGVKRDLKNNRYIIFFLIILFLITLKSLGFFNFFGQLPLINKVIIYKYGAPLYLFSLSVIAGYALSNIKKINLSRLSIFIVTIVIVLEIFSVVYYRLYFADPVAYKAFINAIIPIFALFTIFFILSLSYKKGLINVKVFTILTVLLVAFESALNVPRHHPQRQQPFKKPPFVRFLQQIAHENRIFSTNQYISPNINIVFGLYDYRSLNAIHIKRFISYTGKFRSPEKKTGGDKVTDFAGAFFNLSGVKYIITKNGHNPSDITSLIAKISTNALKKTKKSGIDKEYLITSKSDQPFKSRLLLPETVRYLVFSTEVYNLAKRKKRFEVTVKIESSSSSTDFNRIITTGQTIAKKNKFSIDISQYKGQEINLSFNIQPSYRLDSFEKQQFYGFISGISFANTPLENQFNLIYADEVNIYRNNYALPRSFIVYNYKVAKNPDNALEILGDNNFDYKNQVVLEQNINGFNEINNKPAEEARIDVISPNTVEIVANSTEKGILFLSDAYYPGWKAYVNSKKTKIFAANYLFRAIVIPKGNNKVVFKYEPESFKIGQILFFVGIFVLMLCLIPYGKIINSGVKYLRNKRKRNRG